MKATMNYQELLKAYIMHVAAHEGVSFLRDGDKTEYLTDEQWAELRCLEMQALSESLSEE